MSFGFGPGDIVSLLAFGKKVVDALREEDGSSAQYRVAKQQCDAFVSLMDSVQSLDLSHLPEDFRTQIKVYSKDVEEHLEWFKRCTMDKYDKSMGKNTTRNRFTSSPRKVQWALYAAEDLAEFSMTLNSWLQIINTYMQFRFLNRDMMFEIAGSGPQNVMQRLNPAPTHVSLPYNQKATQARRLENVQNQRLLDTVEEVSNMVYERLLSRPGLPPAERGHVFALPSNPGAEEVFLNNRPCYHHSSAEPTYAPASSSSQATTEDAVDNAVPETANADIVRETNKYLADLKLPQLTKHEEGILSDHKPTHSQVPTLEMEQNQSSSAAKNTYSASQNRGKIPSKTPESHGSFNPASFVSSVLSATQLVGTAAKLAYQLDSAHAYSGVPAEIAILSRRVSQYRQLFEVFFETMKRPTPSHSLQQAEASIIMESKDLLIEIRHLIPDRFGQPRGIVRAAAGAIRWQKRRLRVMHMVEEFEAMKTNISILLQARQMERLEGELLERQVPR